MLFIVYRLDIRSLLIKCLIDHNFIIRYSYSLQDVFAEAHCRSLAYDPFQSFDTIKRS